MFAAAMLATRGCFAAPKGQQIQLTYSAMALSAKREGVKQVPWLSPMEWLETYERIYSNDTACQMEAYKTLLVWKARISKLPVGVDCTLSILQVSLRDREWMPKICTGLLPAQYEDDLCLMYSTTIMRFLNHVSNMGQTKQVSLFQIAKRLNIPEWIVNLRHDTAHGHELPSIGVLRIAINILLAWLHEEYWAPEAETMRDNYIRKAESSDANGSEETRAFADLLELWTVVSLYMRAGYHQLPDVPDVQLQETLQDLYDYTCALSLDEEQRTIRDGGNDRSTIGKNASKTDEGRSLKISQSILLDEISKYLGKIKFLPHEEDSVLNVLLDSELFLPNSELLTVFMEGEDNSPPTRIPTAMITFWQEIIMTLDDHKFLETLILKLIALGEDQREAEYKRHMSALWVNGIAQSFVRMEIAHSTLTRLERKFEKSDKRISGKLLHQKVMEETERSYPFLKHSPSLRTSNALPHCFTDEDFLKRLIFNVNRVSATYIRAVLDIHRAKLSSDKKKSLVKLIEIYELGKYVDTVGDENLSQQVHSAEELRDMCSAKSIDNRERTSRSDDNVAPLADRTLRNNAWQIASDQHWCEWSPGLLPWQGGTSDMLKISKTLPLEWNFPLLESDIVPGIVDRGSLKMQSQINWAHVFREKKMKKRETRPNGDIMINRAINIARKNMK